MPARAKNVHASLQRDIYVTGLYSSGKHRKNKQTMNNVCLGSTYTEYMKKFKILKKFFSGQRRVKLVDFGEKNFSPAATNKYKNFVCFIYNCIEKCNET